MEKKCMAVMQDYWISNLANVSSILFQELSHKHVNWVGFYIARDNQLLLGPFQGKVACTKIAYGRGICGECAINQKPIIVGNVQAHPNHITCDSESRSELVMPIISKAGEFLGVLDIDSKVPNAFTIEDQLQMQRIVDIIVNQGGKWHN